jgi:hypothetical protein
MHLLEIFLPIYEQRGRQLKRTIFVETRRELLERFDGLTSYSRAPAKGFWKDSGEIERDDVIVLDFMVSRLDRSWWKRYRRRLESRFGQRQILVRVMQCGRL